ncbi:aminotransferase class V-fold PLP-dependent enzyme, partial [Streptosporangium algeriense]
LARLRAGLAGVEGVHELSLWGPDHARVGIVSFVVDGFTAREVAETLSGEYGIGVRDGKFCAHPFVRHLLGAKDGGCDDVTASAVRASIGIGSTTEHVDRLIEALRDLVTRR